jgi:hypothetical protein
LILSASETLGVSVIGLTILFAMKITKKDIEQFRNYVIAQTIVIGFLNVITLFYPFFVSLSFGELNSGRTLILQLISVISMFIVDGIAWNFDP